MPERRKFGNVRVTFDEEKQWLRVDRGTIAVLCNLGAQDCFFPVPQSSSPELVSHGVIRIVDGKINLPPDSVAVLRNARYGYMKADFVSRAGNALAPISGFTG